MELSKTKSGKRQKKRYKTIRRLPAYNWFECRKEQKFSYLLLDEDLQGIDNEELFKMFPDIDFESAFLDMITEFFKEFGKPKQYEKEIKLTSEIIDLQLRFAISGDRMLLNGIKILKFKLQKILVNGKDQELGIDQKKEIAAIGKASGVIVDIMTMTTYQYYTQRLLLLENG